MCGAVAYGALARRLPLSGGEYLYLSRLIHPSVGFMAGWISLIAGFTAPIAMMAIVVGKYSLPDSLEQSHAAELGRLWGHRVGDVMPCDPLESRRLVSEFDRCAQGLLLALVLGAGPHFWSRRWLRNQESSSRIRWPTLAGPPWLEVYSVHWFGYR